MTASRPTPPICLSSVLSGLLISSSTCSLSFPPLALLLFSPLYPSSLVPPSSLLFSAFDATLLFQLPFWPPTSFFSLCIFTSSHPPSSTQLNHPCNQLLVQTTGVELIWGWGVCLKLSACLLNSRREKQYLPCLCSLLPLSCVTTVLWPELRDGRSCLD